MKKKLSYLSLIILSAFTWTSLAYSEVSIVPMGNTVQPEGSSKSDSTSTTKKRRRPRRASSTTLKAGTPFLVELSEVLSSSQAQVGQKVSLQAAESIQVSGSTVIERGALVQGSVAEVNNDRKTGKLVVEIKNVEAYNGDHIPVSGKIDLSGEKAHALAKVGEKFNVTTSTDVRLKANRRAKKPILPPSENTTQIGFMDIDASRVKVDLPKGKIKGEAYLIVEAPKGVAVDSILVDSLAITRVNGHSLTPPLQSIREGKKAPEKGDKNKNGVDDLTLTFNAWDFIKYQKPGKNILYLEGKMANGAPFKAATNSIVEY
ncbi:MAG: hypothetical protein H7A32_05505 [Deltaproteobacteria bacterium]|nr:hypothetical protein [Deltaproteobacteria bacterium]